MFWEGVKVFHSLSNHFVDSGLYVYFELGDGFLRGKPFVAVNQTVGELEEVLKPLVEGLEGAGVPFELSLGGYESFYDLYIDLFEDEVAGAHALTGGWLFTHRDVEENNDGIIEAFKTVVSPTDELKGQGFMVGHMWDAGYGRPESNSATHPLFRKASDFVISTMSVPVGASVEEKEYMQGVLTNVIDEALREAGQHGCTYVNEVSSRGDTGWGLRGMC